MLEVGILVEEAGDEAETFDEDIVVGDVGGGWHCEEAGGTVDDLADVPEERGKEFVICGTPLESGIDSELNAPVEEKLYDPDTLDVTECEV